MADETTFSEVVDWLAKREGRSVYIEMGMRDPALDQPGYLHLLAIHTTLGKVGMGEDDGHGGRGTTVVPLGDGESNRVYLDLARISRLELDRMPGSLRVWLHDDALYVGFLG